MSNLPAPIFFPLIVFLLPLPSGALYRYPHRSLRIPLPQLGCPELVRFFLLPPPWHPLVCSGPLSPHSPLFWNSSSRRPLESLINHFFVPNVLPSGGAFLLFFLRLFRSRFHVIFFLSYAFFPLFPQRRNFSPGFFSGFFLKTCFSQGGVHFGFFGRPLLIFLGRFPNFFPSGTPGAAATSPVIYFLMDAPPLPLARPRSGTLYSWLFVL